MRKLRSREVRYFTHIHTTSKLLESKLWISESEFFPDQPAPPSGYHCCLIWPPKAIGNIWSPKCQVSITLCCVFCCFCHMRISTHPLRPSLGNIFLRSLIWFSLSPKPLQQTWPLPTNWAFLFAVIFVAVLIDHAWTLVSRSLPHPDSLPLPLALCPMMYHRRACLRIASESLENHFQQEYLFLLWGWIWFPEIDKC